MSSRLAILGAFIRRDWRIDISYRAAFAFQISGSLLTLALFYFLGEVIDDSEFDQREGLEGGYFGFVAVGIAIFTVVQSALVSFARKLREEQTTGTFEALMATPASPALIILSSAAYELLRGLLNAVLLIVVAVAVFDLGFEPAPNAFAVATAALAGTLVLFASIGVAVGAMTVLFKRVAGIVSLVTVTLGLMSGVYFPTDVLPGVLQTVADVIPFTWSLDLLRAALLGGEVDGLLLLALALSAAALLPLSLYGFALAVRRARRTGTLAEY